jgi:hypothetical protein
MMGFFLILVSLSTICLFMFKIDWLILKRPLGKFLDASKLTSNYILKRLKKPDYETPDSAYRVKEKYREPQHYIVVQYWC